MRKVLKLVLIIIFINLFLAIFGCSGIEFSSGCRMRYALGPDKEIIKDIVDASQITLKVPPISPKVNLNEWISSGISVAEGQKITINAKGVISSCRVLYVNNKNLSLPRVIDNLDNDYSNVDERQLKSEIYKNGLPIILNASPEWVTIAQIGDKDLVEVKLLAADFEFPERRVFNSEKSTSFQEAQIDKADCSEEKIQYDAICNRFTVYPPSTVPVECRESSIYHNIVKEYPCDEDNTCKVKQLQALFKVLSKSGRSINKNDCKLESEEENATCLIEKILEKFPDLESSKIIVAKEMSLPTPYYDNGLNSFNFTKTLSNEEMKDYTEEDWKKYLEDAKNKNEEKDLDDLALNLQAKSCKDVNDHYDENNDKASWFVSGSGLIFRLDGEAEQIIKLPKTYSEKIIYSKEFQKEENDKPAQGGQTKKLQVRFFHPNSSSGGYVIGLKQTSCIIRDGELLHYIVKGANPNVDDVGYQVELGKEFSSDSAGQLYFKIHQDSTINNSDYSGYYSVYIDTYNKVTEFSTLLNNIIPPIKNFVKSSADQYLRNITCYKTSQYSCLNFFNYIKALLIIYIIIFAINAALSGNINQYDIFLRMVKIVFIAGLVNGNTFEFFTVYLKDLIWNYSEHIISNLSGYDHDDTNAVAPLMFLNKIMTKIFFSKTFFSQVLAVVSGGYLGVLYFTILAISLFVFIVAAFRVIVIYIMSFFMIALLITVGPIFLTFILFDKTRELFDSWIKQLMHYIFAPILIFAGFIVLTKLFEVFLDLVLSYSICWRCAIPINIPLVDDDAWYKTLFCINWYIPWGVNVLAGESAYQLQSFVILILISNIIYSYVDISMGFTSKIFGSAGADIDIAKKISSSSLSFLQKKAFSSNNNSKGKGDEKGDSDEKGKGDENKGEGGEKSKREDGSKDILEQDKGVEKKGGGDENKGEADKDKEGKADE